MEQLSGLDALFIHAEMHGMPMHISTLSIYDPSTSKSGKVDFMDVVNLFESRIKNQIPVLQCRLVTVPLGLDHPYWEEDPNFDLVYHIRHIALPKPGNWHKLCSLVANLHAQPLNRSRPLWEAYVIDGLESIKGLPPGAFAVMLKVHHSIMDGQTSAQIFNALHSNIGDPKSDAGDSYQDHSTHELPDELTTRQMLVRAYLNNMKRIPGILKLTVQGFSTYAQMKLAFKNHDVKTLHKPKTRFNGDISPRRIVDRLLIPVSGVNAIKNMFRGQSQNEVALAIIGGALRKYLKSKDELPESSLVAGVPIDVRSDDDKLLKGNIINVMNISLKTDVNNPVERMQAIHAETKSGRTFAYLLGDHSIHDLFDNLYPGLVSWGIHTAVDRKMMEKFPPANNTIVTTMPGIKAPVHLSGARLIETFGMGPLIPNTGLSHSICISYDHMVISFTACRHMMDDPDFYVSCMRESYEELLQAATAVMTPPHEPAQPYVSTDTAEVDARLKH